MADPSTFTAVDLSRLPAPTIVETLDFDTIYGQMLAALQALVPAFDATVESDPVIKLLQVAAYRELLLRARVNDAARARFILIRRITRLRNRWVLSPPWLDIWPANWPERIDGTLRNTVTINSTSILEIGGGWGETVHITTPTLTFKNVYALRGSRLFKLAAMRTAPLSRLRSPWHVTQLHTPR